MVLKVNKADDPSGFVERTGKDEDGMNWETALTYIHYHV